MNRNVSNADIKYFGKALEGLNQLEELEINISW